MNAAPLIDLDAELQAGSQAPVFDAFGADGPRLPQMPQSGLKPEWAKLTGKIRRASRLMDEGKEAEAARVALKIVEAAPDFGLANQVMAMALERLGRLSTALEFYERAYKVDPNNVDLYRNLALVAWKMGMLEAAEKFLRIFTQMDPDNWSGLSNLACVLRDQGRYEDAIEIVRAEIYRRPDVPELWNTMATVMLEQGDPKNAETFAREAIRLSDIIHHARHNLAYALELNGDLKGARAQYEAARDMLPPNKDRVIVEHALSMCCLAGGDLEAGWTHYESRLDIRYPMATLFALDAPRWDGVDLDAVRGKTLLVIGEQGLGDEILFLNMLGDLIKVVGPEGEVRVGVEHRLVDLIQRSFPDAKVARHATIKRENRDIRGAPALTEDGKVDLYVPMATALRSLRRRVEDFPDTPAFLTPDPARVDHWRGQFSDSPGVKVGLIWKSLKMDAKRSKFFADLDDWRPVLETGGARFVNLQYGDISKDLDAIRARYGAEFVQPEGIDLKDDLDDLAALCSACDLVVGPMNATMNIAAACGVPCLIVHASGDGWTLLGSGEMPWYPSSRSFYGDHFRDWKTAMSRMAEALRGEIASVQAA